MLYYFNTLLQFSYHLMINKRITAPYPVRTLFGPSPSFDGLGNTRFRTGYGAGWGLAGCCRAKKYLLIP